jgi:hypothetical protein
LQNVPRRCQIAGPDEVTRDLDRAGALCGIRGQRLGESTMHASAFDRRELADEYSRVDGVRELHARPPDLDHADADAFGQGCAVRQSRRHSIQHVPGRARLQQRGKREGLSRFVGEGAQACRRRIGSRSRGEVFDHVIGQPGRADRVQFVRELLNDQRVSVGDLAEALDRAAARREAELRGETTDLVNCKWRHLGDIAAWFACEQRKRGREFPGFEGDAAGGDDEERRGLALHEPCDVADDVEGCLVGPLQIVDDEEQRMFAGEIDDRLGEREEQAAAIARVDLFAVLAGHAIEAPCQHSRVLGLAIHEQRQQCVSQREIGESSVLVRATPHDSRGRGFAADESGKLLEEPGLADPERALQQHGCRVPLSSIRPMTAEGSELDGATHERE